MKNLIVNLFRGSLLLLSIFLMLNMFILGPGHTSCATAVVFFTIGLILLLFVGIEEWDSLYTTTSTPSPSPKKFEHTITYKGENMTVTLSFDCEYDLTDTEKSAFNAVANCSERSGEDPHSWYDEEDEGDLSLFEYLFLSAVPAIEDHEEIDDLPFPETAHIPIDFIDVPDIDFK